MFLFVFIYEAGVEPSPLLLQPYIGIWMIDVDCGGVTGINALHEKPNYSKKTCPNAALHTTVPK
jgi:hypothetical protein